MALENLLMTNTRENNIPPLPHANQVYAVNSSNTVAHHQPQVKEHNCSPGDLLGPVGLFVQALLALLAFTSLIGKDLINSIISI